MTDTPTGPTLLGSGLRLNLPLRGSFPLRLVMMMIMMMMMMMMIVVMIVMDVDLSVAAEFLPSLYRPRQVNGSV